MDCKFHHAVPTCSLLCPQNHSLAMHRKVYLIPVNIYMLLGGELLAERCHTNNLMPSIPILCLPTSRVDPKVLGPNVLVYHYQPVDLGQPGGLRQSGGGRSAAAMTRRWSSSGADRARCPKNLNRNDLAFSETGKQPVMLLTVSLVVCLVYGIRKIFHRHQVSKASRRFARVLLTVHVSHP